MNRWMHNERGFGLPELLVAVVALGVIIMFVIPAFAAPKESTAVYVARVDVQGIDAAMVESAAAMANVEEPQENYTLRELVSKGYLNVDLTEKQAKTLVWKTESGGFLYQP